VTGPEDTAPRGAAPTLADVARAAGVSLATASRVLNGSSRRVRAENGDRVLAAAERLRYSPNAQAQAVARGTTTTVALVVGDIADPYFAEIAAGAMEAAEAAGLTLVISATSGSPERERSALEALVGLRPRAVVLAASRRVGVRPADPLDRLRDNGTAVVALVSDGDAPPPGATPLVVGNRSGAAALAEALVDAGHTRFAILAGEESVATAAARADGFLEGLHRRGLGPATDVIQDAFDRDGGARAMRRLLDSSPEPGRVCVFAVNDVMAVGAMTAIRAAGLVPGRDVAVAGFDDVRTLADITPALTTVRLPLERIGALAVRRALGEDVPSLVAGDVVLRASTAR
jgi:LacI family transcriptional regulator